MSLPLRNLSQVPVSCSWHLVDTVHDLSSSNQTDDDTGANNESQDEAVLAVPWRSPAAVCGGAVDGVQAVEGEELRDQGVLDREHNGGPSDSGSNDTDGVALVALVATVAGPFETPVDGTEEGDDLGGVSAVLRLICLTAGFMTYSSSVADLERFKDVESVLGGVLAEEETRSAGSSVC